MNIIEIKQEIELNAEGFDNFVDAYYAFTKKVAVHPDANQKTLAELVYLALGIAGEAGEVVDVIKKAHRRGYMTERDAALLEQELGDLMFYWTRMCQANDSVPSDVIKGNITKLTQRMEAGTLKDR